jgi:omega-6 fatty acid desaturase (delta-12 desaturase)
MNNLEIAKRIKEYQKPNDKKAIIQTLVCLIPAFIFIVISFYTYKNNYWMNVLLTPLISIFMIKSFMILHDCGHKSFSSYKTFNEVLGYIIGFVFLVPYPMWKYIHTTHHVTSGNMSKRHLNPDIWTLTVKEFKELNWYTRSFYKTYRSAFNWIFLAPSINFFILYRIPFGKFNKVAKQSIMIHNVLYIACYFIITYFMPFTDFLKIYLPPAILTYSVGLWLFYIQHQFEETYWEDETAWDFEDASLRGSSYLKLPKIGHWITSNIGYHHIHHLRMNIPNYHLEKAHEAVSSFLDIKPITAKEIIKSFYLTLWDDEKKKLVSFKEI